MSAAKWALKLAHSINSTYPRHMMTQKIPKPQATLREMAKTVQQVKYTPFDNWNEAKIQLNVNVYNFNCNNYNVYNVNCNSCNKIYSLVAKIQKLNKN